MIFNDFNNVYYCIIIIFKMLLGFIDFNMFC